jgi:pyridoxal biosynthesis lyase PdxS
MVSWADETLHINNSQFFSCVHKTQHSFAVVRRITRRWKTKRMVQQKGRKGEGDVTMK